MPLPRLFVCLLLVGATCGALLPTGTAWADGCPAAPASLVARRKVAGEWFARGQRAAEANDLVGAIEAYTCSLRISPHPFTAFNLGLEAERIGDVDVAIDSFEAFLALAPEDSADRPEVERRLQTLRARRQQVRHKLEGQPPGRSPAAAPPAAPAARRPTPPVAPGRHETVSPSFPRLALASTLVGAAALGAGGALYLASRSKGQACATLWSESRWEASDSACQTARTELLLSRIGAGVGAVGLVTGAILYLGGRGGETKENRGTARLGYLPLAGGGGISLTGRF